MTSPFLWGVATSSYQIEGAVENDWTAWEAAGRLKAPGRPCGVATGHRERWRSDFSLLPTIGANAYRFSVEWSRIEPRPSQFDWDALALEVERVELLRRLGIEPVVTLNHYTHPSWFWEDGGWEDRRSVDRFARFASVVAEALEGRVRRWVTLNEPIVLLLGGFLAGTGTLTKIDIDVVTGAEVSNLWEAAQQLHNQLTIVTPDPTCAASGSCPWFTGRKIFTTNDSAYGR